VVPRPTNDRHSSTSFFFKELRFVFFCRGPNKILSVHLEIFFLNEFECRGRNLVEVLIEKFGLTCL